MKLVADANTGAILGGHIAAAAAGEMIHEVVAAMEMQATVADLAAAIHAYPSYSEGITVAAGATLHRLRHEHSYHHRH